MKSSDLTISGNLD